MKKQAFIFLFLSLILVTGCTKENTVKVEDVKSSTTVKVMEEEKNTTTTTIKTPALTTKNTSSTTSKKIVSKVTTDEVATTKTTTKTTTTTKITTTKTTSTTKRTTTKTTTTTKRTRSKTTTTTTTTLKPSKLSTFILPKSGEISELHLSEHGGITLDKNQLVNINVIISDYPLVNTNNRDAFGIKITFKAKKIYHLDGEDYYGTFALAIFNSNGEVVDCRKLMTGSMISINDEWSKSYNVDIIKADTYKIKVVNFNDTKNICEF